MGDYDQLTARLCAQPRPVRDEFKYNTHIVYLILFIILVEVIKCQAK